MSLPENTLSTHPLPAPFVGGRAYPVTPLVDYETGGIALDDSSEGLQYQVWRARVLEDDDTGEDYVMLDAEHVDAFEVIRGHKITQFSFTFDRNMRLHYTWVEGGVAFFRWYDTQTPGMRVDELGPQYLTPRLAHDDKRDTQSGIADIILAYLYRYEVTEEYDCFFGLTCTRTVTRRDLRYVQQRDRYGTERTLGTDVESPGLVKIGLNRQLRFQFLLQVPR